MTTDTGEGGLERLICKALTGDACVAPTGGDCDPAADVAGELAGADAV